MTKWTHCLSPQNLVSGASPLTWASNWTFSRFFYPILPVFKHHQTLSSGHFYLIFNSESFLPTLYMCMCVHVHIWMYGGVYCRVVICASMVIALYPICLGHIFPLNPEPKGMANAAGHPAPFCLWVLESQVHCHAYFNIWVITPASALHPSSFCRDPLFLALGFLFPVLFHESLEGSN